MSRHLAEFKFPNVVAFAKLAIYKAYVIHSDLALRQILPTALHYLTPACSSLPLQPPYCFPRTALPDPNYHMQVIVSGGSSIFILRRPMDWQTYIMVGLSQALPLHTRAVIAAAIFHDIATTCIIS